MLVATRFGDAEQVHRVAAPLARASSSRSIRSPSATARAPQIAQRRRLRVPEGPGRQRERADLLLPQRRSQRAPAHRRQVPARQSAVVARWQALGVLRQRPRRRRLRHLRRSTSRRARRRAWSSARRRTTGIRSTGRRTIRSSSCNATSRSTRRYLYIVDAWSGIITPLDTRASQDRHHGREVRAGRPRRATSPPMKTASSRSCVTSIPVTRRIAPAHCRIVPWDVETSTPAPTAATSRTCATKTAAAASPSSTIRRSSSSSPPERAGRPHRRPALRSRGQAARLLRRVRAVAARCLRLRSRAQRARALDAQRSRARRRRRPSSPAELVHYPTWDRVNGKPRTISAYVYRPRTPGPHPVLINIHGGPESQYRAGLRALLPVPRQRAGHRGGRAERARLRRLRQDLPASSTTACCARIR